MYTGYKLNTHKSISSINTRRGSSETKAETLQKEIDVYTRKIEQEKRKYVTVQEDYQAVMRDFEEERTNLDGMKKANAEGEIVTLQARLKMLEGSLEKSVSFYDETLASNNKLKVEIDRLRREKKNFKDVQKKL